MVSNEGREPIESVGEFIVEKYKRNEISPKYRRPTGARPAPYRRPTGALPASGFDRSTRPSTEWRMEKIVCIRFDVYKVSTRPP